jgi:hypothetical protein
VSSTDEDQSQGLSSSNQVKAEPIPPTPGHSPAPAAMDVEDMNVGGADPQAPSHPQAGPPGDPAHSGLDPVGPAPTGAAPSDRRPAPGPGSSSGRGAGPEQPGQSTTGAARRAPGSLGEPADEEQIETDVERSARNASTRGTPGTEAGPGDPAGVPVVSEQPAPGTSQESAVAQGTRTPG